MGLKGIEPDEVQVPDDDSLILSYFPKMGDENSKPRGIKRF